LRAGEDAFGFVYYFERDVDGGGGFGNLAEEGEKVGAVHALGEVRVRVTAKAAGEIV
jgi:hypothetical protein